MERRTMRIGKGNMTPGRVHFLLPAIPITPSWASPLRAEEPPRPVGYYVDAALSGYPSLASMRQRITGSGTRRSARGAGRPERVGRDHHVPVRTGSFREEDMTGKEIGLSQMIPYPGKRAHAVRIVEEGEGAGGIRPGGDAEHAPRGRQDGLCGAVHRSCAGGSAAPAPRRPRPGRARYPPRCSRSGRGGSPTFSGGRWSSRDMREMLRTLENREKVLSIRLNTIAALPASGPRCRPSITS